METDGAWLSASTDGVQLGWTYRPWRPSLFHHHMTWLGRCHLVPSLEEGPEADGLLVPSEQYRSTAGAERGLAPQGKEKLRSLSMIRICRVGSIPGHERFAGTPSDSFRTQALATTGSYDSRFLPLELYSPHHCYGNLQCLCCLSARYAGTLRES
jgi:hypothetical protein